MEEASALLKSEQSSWRTKKQQEEIELERKRESIERIEKISSNMREEAQKQLEELRAKIDREREHMEQERLKFSMRLKTIQDEESRFEARTTDLVVSIIRRRNTHETHEMCV